MHMNAQRAAVIRRMCCHLWAEAAAGPGTSVGGVDVGRERIAHCQNCWTVRSPSMTCIPSAYLPSGYRLRHVGSVLAKPSLASATTPRSRRPMYARMAAGAGRVVADAARSLDYPVSEHQGKPETRTD